jgi:hypothetical protein
MNDNLKSKQRGTAIVVSHINMQQRPYIFIDLISRNFQMAHDVALEGISLFRMLHLPRITVVREKMVQYVMSNKEAFSHSHYHFLFQ